MVGCWGTRCIGMGQHKDALFRGTRANEYESFQKAIPHHDSFQRNVAQMVVKDVLSLAIKKGESARICELGVGTGVTLSHLIRESRGLVGIDRIDAVDSSPQMISNAKFNHPNAKVSYIEKDLFVHLEGAVPLYDGIYSVYTIHNMVREKQAEAFGLVFSRLKAGGCFVYGDILAYSDRAVQKSVFDWQVQMYERHVPSPMKEEWLNHILADQENYHTLDEVIALLTGIGFTVRICFREKLEATLLALKS